MSDPLVQDFSIYVYFKLCFFKRKKFRFYIDSVGFMSWGYVKFHNNYHNDKYTRCYKYLKNCLPVPHFEHRSLPAISSPLISHASDLAASRRNQGVLYTHNDRSSPHPHVRPQRIYFRSDQILTNASELSFRLVFLAI